MIEPIYIHENTGHSRRERRKYYNYKTGKINNVPKEYQEDATNEPYRKDDTGPVESSN